MSGQAAKERAEAYRHALQELTLFRSRTSAALLQARTALAAFYFSPCAHSPYPYRAESGFQKPPCFIMY